MPEPHGVVAHQLVDADQDNEPVRAIIYNHATLHIAFNPDPPVVPIDLPEPSVLPPIREVRQPMVSIVILSHRPAMLQQALRSALRQTFPDCQIVVQHCALPWPEKLNEAVNATVGKWVVILCDDDTLDPQFVERTIRFHELADIVYTDRRIFQEDDAPESGRHFRMHGEEVQGEQAYGIKPNPATWAFGHSLPMTCLIRREWWDKMGGHDAQIPHSDTEFWYRSAVAGARCVYVPEPLFCYREHSEQYSRKHNACWDAFKAFHRKHFLAFGICWDDAKAVTADEWYIPVLPPEYREAYQQGHLMAEV